MLAAVAVESGHGELTQAPLVPIGHSAAASFPWYVAAWKPERTLACISVSGQWPYWLDEKNAPHVIGRSINTVPVIVAIGEYEWANDRMKDGLAVRGKHPRLPLTGVGCPADDHFNVTDEKVELLALYLKKAAEYRLVGSRKAGSPPSLADIPLETSGWLVDRYRAGEVATAAPAPVGAYEGRSAEAFWCFDEELARAIDDFQQRHRGKPTLVGYVQDASVIPQDKNAHQQVTIPFRPEDDGCTFSLDAAFLETVPEGRPERWTGKKGCRSVDKPAQAMSPITIERITGPIRHIGDMLRLTEIPVRARRPISITVVAWQFGRATKPRVQTAEPVVRTLCVNSQ